MLFPGQKYHSMKNNRHKPDLRLYLVTDRTLSLGRPLEWIVSEAVKGGVSFVQLREKELCTKDFLELAKALKCLLSPLNIPLVINDRVDIALAADADGVHIGQSDMPCEDARKLLGYDKIIGLSIESLEDAIAANNLDIDYIAYSPVFDTLTKTNTSRALGLEGIKKISSFTRYPSVAIGGINKSNATDVINSGANGISVVSAIMSAEDPLKSAKELRSIVDKALSNRDLKI